MWIINNIYTSDLHDSEGEGKTVKTGHLRNILADLDSGSGTGAAGEELAARWFGEK